IRGARVKLEGLVRCRLADLVGVVYRDPDGGRVFAYQTDRGDVEATLYRRGPRGWSEWGRLSAAGCAAYEYASRRPVSGVEVVEEPAGGRFAEPGLEPFPRSDGLVTSLRGRPMTLLTADCLPIAIAATGGERLALLHAGWRGLVAGIAEAGVKSVGGPLCAAV